MGRFLLAYRDTVNPRAPRFDPRSRSSVAHMPCRFTEALRASQPEDLTP